jgi:TIGR03009 family protein
MIDRSLLVGGLCLTLTAAAAAQGVAPQAAPLSTAAQQQQLAAATGQLTPPGIQPLPMSGPGAPGTAQAGVALQPPVPPQANVGPVAPPFQLSDIEKQQVYTTLKMWEQTSQQVENFNAEFTRLEYDAVFGPGRDKHMIESTGTLSFSKPDKGSFKIDAIKRWTKKNAQDTSAAAPGEYLLQKDEVGEHWVCDGKAIYEYNHRDKQLVVTRIPETMRGQNISDGPLPFLFGAQADKLDERYWIRTKESDPSQIWLEAYPKWQADAANYDSVDVMLDRKTMQPKALQVRLPGGQQWHVYVFDAEKTRTNEKNLGAWFTGLFSAPRTPFGWTKVNAETIAPQAANSPGSLQR